MCRYWTLCPCFVCLFLAAAEIIIKETLTSSKIVYTVFVFPVQFKNIVDLVVGGSQVSLNHNRDMGCIDLILPLDFYSADTQDLWYIV